MLLNLKSEGEGMPIEEEPEDPIEADWDPKIFFGVGFVLYNIMIRSGRKGKSKEEGIARTGEIEEQLKLRKIKNYILALESDDDGNGYHHHRTETG